MTPLMHGLSEAAIAHLSKNGIEIRFRVKNNAVYYSIMNRPSVAETGLSDEKLAVCLTHAGQTFSMRRVPKIAPEKREQVTRADGRQMAYDQILTLDWSIGEIASSRGRDLSLQVLSIVIQDLVRGAERQKKSEPLN